MRVILAALLGSELSTRELEELASDLKEHEFSCDLADLLHAVLVRVTDAGSKREWRESEFRSVASNILQRRKLPKRVLLEFVRRAAPDATNRLRPSATIQEILRDFFDMATDREINDFMQMLQEANKSDAYLRGIMGRN